MLEVSFSDGDACKKVNRNTSVLLCSEVLCCWTNLLIIFGNITIRYVINFYCLLHKINNYRGCKCHIPWTLCLTHTSLRWCNNPSVTMYLAYIHLFNKKSYKTEAKSAVLLSRHPTYRVPWLLKISFSDVSSQFISFPSLSLLLKTLACRKRYVL